MTSSTTPAQEQNIPEAANPSDNGIAAMSVELSEALDLLSESTEIMEPSDKTMPPAPAEQPIQSYDLTKASLYINRELSQIEFNRRVLNECKNKRHPLLERLKYIAIFCSNMDEIFMVRVSGLKQQFALGVGKLPADGMTPRKQLISIHKQTEKLIVQQAQYWQEMKAELAEENIEILAYNSLKTKRKAKLAKYFERDIFPVLTPLAFDPGHPFPHISNLSLNLAVVLRDPEKSETHFARVKVPGPLPRLVSLKRYAPDDMVQPSTHRFIWIEELIAANLDRLFPGMEIIAAYPFRVTRNTDMDIQEEEADDLLLTIERSLWQRHFGATVRLEVTAKMPDDIRKVLAHNLKIKEFDLYAIDGPLGLSCLWELYGLERFDLKDMPYKPKLPQVLKSGESIFDIIARQDLLLYRPYDSFGPVIDFVNEAAEDPKVKAIKMTLYRVGSKPPLVNALIRARNNGKQVAALVELKARFDEESNIEWARALEEAGVHVVYGLIGLKTHAKVCLVVREEDAGLMRYLHLSTGNYNASTARLYTDLDYMTCDPDFGADASDLFNTLTGYGKNPIFQKFLTAPYNVRSKILEHIEEEMAYGEDGHIILKCNALIDPPTIQALYRASQAGVRVDLNIRGVCCLRPGVENISENIRVLSTVGRFLEHTRIYYFHNGGDEVLYLGSADLMPRNLDRRVEVVFPITNKPLRDEIVQNVLGVHLRDTAQSHLLQSNGKYVSLRASAESDEELFSAQDWFLRKDRNQPTPLTPEQPELPLS